MAFNAQERQIENMFSGSTVYCIPDFQRKYVWGNEQLKQLIDDILLSISNNENHFIGTVVFDKKNELNIIDGQQRFLTIYIFLICIVIFVNSENCNLEMVRKKEITDYVKSMLIFKNGLQPKTERLKTNYRIIKKAVEAVDDDEYDFENIKNIIAISDEKEILNVFNFFFNFLFFKKIAKEEYEYNINEIYEKLLNCKLIEVISTNTADAYSVFEILNARGVQLTQMQLLKAYMFKHLRNKEMIVSVYEKWDEISSELINLDEDVFLFHALKCCTDYKKIQVNNTYNVIVKNHKRFSPTEHNNFLKELLALAKIYKKYDMVNVNADEPLEKMITFCNVKKIKVFRPLFLSMESKKDLFEKEIFNKLIELLYKFIVLNNVRKTYSNKLEDTICLLSHTIYTSSNCFEIQKKLLEFICSNRHLVGDDECINDFKSILYSNKAAADNNNSKYIIMLFKNLYDVKQKENGIKIDYTSVNVEHILNDDLFEKRKMNLGNLLLLNKELNEAVLNKSYSEKRAIYMKNGVEYIKQFALDNEVFDLQKSVERTDCLSKEIFNTFKIDYDYVNNEIKKANVLIELEKKGIFDVSYLNNCELLQFKEKIEKRQDLNEKQKQELLDVVKVKMTIN